MKEENFTTTLQNISLNGKIWTQQIDLAPNVWLHSSVGRASHRYRGGHGFESRWSPDSFQASSFQLLKLENWLRWSLFTFIYNRSTKCEFHKYFTLQNHWRCMLADFQSRSQHNFQYFLPEDWSPPSLKINSYQRVAWLLTWLHATLST